MGTPTAIAGDLAPGRGLDSPARGRSTTRRRFGWRSLPALAIAFSAVLATGCATAPDTTARVSDRERVQDMPLIEVPKAHKGPRYDKPKEAHEYYVRQRVRPGQVIPTERYEIARRAMARMPQFQFGEGGRTRAGDVSPSATIIGT